MNSSVGGAPGAGTASFGSVEKLEKAFRHNQGVSSVNYSGVDLEKSEDYQIFASGANGKSQFLQSPGILNFKKGLHKSSLPFIKMQDDIKVNQWDSAGNHSLSHAVVPKMQG